MKLFFRSSAVPAMVTLLPVTSAFVARSPAFHHQTLATTYTSASTSSSSRNMAGSMEFQDYGGGIEAGGMRKRQRRGLEDLFDPEKQINKYIQPPQPVAARSAGLDGSILVSGWANDTPTFSSHQAIFDLLNHEDSAFGFESIVAFVDDEAFAKKRLLSRSARYSGLLNKLSFAQSGSAGGMPTLEQLKGMENWLAHVEVDPSNPKATMDTIKQIGELSSGTDSTVRNVALLVSNSSHLSQVALDDCVAALSALDSNSSEKGVTFSVVSVGSLDDSVGEGERPYEITDFGTADGVLLEGATMSRAESYRLISDCLALESGANKALTFAEVTATATIATTDGEEVQENTAAKLIKGLRSAGYTRPQEIHHMMTTGVSNYTATIATYKQTIWDYENPDPVKVKAEKAERDKADQARLEKSREDFDAKKKQEIDDIARSWAKREYFRKSMGGNMGMSEDEYIESVWDRAMFEGDLKYRMMHGQETDERKELSEFLDKKTQKERTMLKRAQETFGTKTPEGGFD
jgi:hypothetical protein